MDTNWRYYFNHIDDYFKMVFSSHASYMGVDIYKLRRIYILEMVGHIDVSTINIFNKL